MERLAQAARPAGEPGPGPSPLARPAPSGHVGPDGHPAGVLGGRSLLPRAGPARRGQGASPGNSRDGTKSTGAATRQFHTQTRPDFTGNYLCRRSAIILRYFQETV